jgi:hypothetical protein
MKNDEKKCYVLLTATVSDLIQFNAAHLGNFYFGELKSFYGGIPWENFARLLVKWCSFEHDFVEI